MKKRELVILIGIVVIAVIALFLLRRPEKEEVQLVAIQYQNKIIQRFNPNEDATYHIQGSYGTLDVEVKDNKWHVVNEECPNHICNKMGWKDITSIEPIVCFPNEIMIFVEETNDN